jgi:teichuronic acid biosynthesis glycosyltransferase TuaG
MLVSVVLPYYKDPIHILESVRSVFQQNYKNWELIIVDNENSYESKVILKKIFNLNKKKIRIFSTQTSSGVAKARNLGIKKSKGTFVAFLDSDDFWRKDKLKKQISLINKYNYDFCYTWYVAFKGKNSLYEVKSPKYLNYNTLIKSCPICCSSVLLKKKVLKKLTFNNHQTKEDYDLWLRISKKNFKFIGIEEYLTYYRVRNNSLSSNQLNKFLNAYKIYNKIYKNNFFFIIYCIARLYFNAFKKRNFFSLI